MRSTVLGGSRWGREMVAEGVSGGSDWGMEEMGRVREGSDWGREEVGEGGVSGEGRWRRGEGGGEGGRRMKANAYLRTGFAHRGTD